MIDVLERQVIGYRADGRAVSLVRGGAEEGATTTATAPEAGGEGAAGAGQEGAAGDGSEEVEFSEENFKKIVDDLNKERAERATAEAEYQRKLHTTSQEAKKYRLQVRSLAGSLAEEATGKPGPKGAAAAKATAASEESDARLAELSAKLEAAQTRMLTSEAQAALLRAEATPKHVERLARMLDLNADGRDDVPSIAEQIAEIKSDMPELFGAAQAQATATAGGAGGGAGARVLRAAPAVAGKGAAGRGGEAPKAPTTAEVLANRLLGKSDE